MSENHKKLIEELIEIVANENASDLHICEGRVPSSGFQVFSCRFLK
jgi:Tfp pilus assembly pilus retraction ATPase PilT